MVVDVVEVVNMARLGMAWHGMAWHETFFVKGGGIRSIPTAGFDLLAD